MDQTQIKQTQIRNVHIIASKDTVRKTDRIRLVA